MNGYEKQVKELLKQYGWRFLRHGKGSHEIWTDGHRRVTVNKECRSRHTANEILKQAGVRERL